ncbi:Bifunctional inhibitor/lipid-transfer protein/seed storage 2S albumin superfamily protein [Striga hermonthica]|uniref:Bifunctional inhibitor/lipid-transfer protein/seed storage 2S albumin superfamily protein n=1 Tax=Striga hermonthica TaxID=68872 RepID=A0A9N7MZM5_STRHE|nr:Bifunctional inhibitor/lipid-transfer protein/seed storage 2S albumin superfamily protein [Striga hermonthica]
MDSKKATPHLLFLYMINLIMLFALSSGCNNKGCTNSPSPSPSPSPKLRPNPSPSPSPSKGTCPRDALKLGVCANLLHGTIGVIIRGPPDHRCCSVLHGLTDLEAAVCLCKALKANVMGTHLKVLASLTLLLNKCGKTLPKGFNCN